MPGLSEPELPRQSGGQAIRAASAIDLHHREAEVPSLTADLGVPQRIAGQPRCEHISGAASPQLARAPGGIGSGGAELAHGTTRCAAGTQPVPAS